jgi:hypothetical protein
MKKQTKKEIKIKDLFTLSERTNNGAVVTTLENGNKYCFGYFSEEDKPEIKNMMAKRERKVTASLSRRDLNANIFADKINNILKWWRDNLDKYPVIVKAAKQLKRIEDKITALDSLNTRINNHEQTADIMKYNGIRKEINQAISARKREYLNIRARYTRMFYRVHSWQLLKKYDIIDIYNALPSNWEEMAKQGVTSVNTELSESARTQTAPEPTAVEGASMAASEPTAVEGASMAAAEPTAVEIPTAVEGVKMWLISTFAAVAACLIVFICLSIKPRTTATAATAAPTVATISEAEEIETINAADVVTIEAEINDVICTGSIDPYINRVKEEIITNYRAVMKSQLKELAELASVDDSEVFAALETSETDPETPESVPTVETIEDTENTPESVEIMPTDTDTETDTGTVSDNTEIDYNSSEYVELSVITTDANGNQVVNVYSVPLNE